VRTATAEARATQAIATFTPEPPTPTIYPVGYRAPWADKMVKQADGTWMAPKEVVLEIVSRAGEYEQWRRSARTIAFLKSPPEEIASRYSQFLTGFALQDIRSYVNTREFDGVFVGAVQGYRVLRTRFSSANGLVAQVDVESTGREWDVYKVPGFEYYTSFSEPDSIETLEMTYEVSSKNWKVSNYVVEVPLAVR
jgi:hypothetical protein